MDISGLLRLFIKFYKEFQLLFHTHKYKSLIWAPKLHAPKINKKRCSNCSRIVPVISLNNSPPFILKVTMGQIT